MAFPFLSCGDGLVPAQHGVAFHEESNFAGENGNEEKRGPNFGQALIKHSRACVSGFRLAPVEVFLFGSESLRR